MDRYGKMRTFYQGVAADIDVAATDSSKTAIIALVANQTIYIQRIELAIVTHAAQTITFQDNAGTPVKIAAHTDASAAAGVPSQVLWDFGPDGTPLTVGKQLDIATSGAGIAARVHVEGYRKLTTVAAA